MSRPGVPRKEEKRYNYCITLRFLCQADCNSHHVMIICSYIPAQVHSAGALFLSSSTRIRP